MQPTMVGTDTMILSRNELRSAVVKAARGSSIPVGVCTDLAASTLWLCGQGVDGVGALLAALASGEASTEPRRAGASDPRSKVVSGRLRAADCLVVRDGPSLVDLVAASVVDTVELDSVDVPQLLVGLVGVASIGDVGRWRIDFGHTVVSCSGIDSVIAGPDWQALSAPGPCRAIMSRVDHAPPTRSAGAVASAGSNQAASGPIEIDDATWARLLEIAARTYVPATDQSRLSGAGAGLTDND